jgi:hypothetical protein
VIPLHSKIVADGVVSFLERLAGGNVHDKGIISATGTGGTPRNATDIQSDSYFCSANAANETLTYDFKNSRIAVTHYFLRSNGHGVDGCHLRSWVIEVSDDGLKWKEIDRRDNNVCLNGPNRNHTFEIQYVVESRFIRIRSIGVCWDGSHSVYIRAFELFGGLRIRDSV